MPPRQQAIFVLRDVLGFSAAEIAENLETTPASVDGALRRARQTLGSLLPNASQHNRLRALGDRRVRKIAQRFADAYKAGDVEGIISVASACGSIAIDAVGLSRYGDRPYGSGRRA